MSIQREHRARRNWDTPCWNIKNFINLISIGVNIRQREVKAGRLRWLRQCDACYSPSRCECGTDLSEGDRSVGHGGLTLSSVRRLHQQGTIEGTGCPGTVWNTHSPYVWHGVRNPRPYENSYYKS